VHLAIDASNIRQGGGMTHLSQLLSLASPADSGFTQVTVWACRSTLAQLPSRPWLIKYSASWTDAGLLQRLLGQQLLLKSEMSRLGCDVLFSPGGSVPFHTGLPVVTMSQNMLPFEPREAFRFGRWSWMRLKMWLLRQSQGRSLKAADGLIFLTEYAQENITRWLGTSQGIKILIPHGIDSRFATPPKTQHEMDKFSMDQAFTFLYVSILMPYKHQIQVAQAANCLRQQGYPIKIRFIGEDWGGYGQELRKTLQQLDPQEEFLFWPGSVPFANLHAEYQSADAFLFASSCENLPNILIEAMASGLPIACSTRGPMPEVLGDAGIYFDPVVVQEMVEAMRTLVENPDLRRCLAEKAYERSKAYSWKKCADETFGFIATVAKLKSQR